MVTIIIAVNNYSFINKQKVVLVSFEFTLNYYYYFNPNLIITKYRPHNLQINNHHHYQIIIIAIMTFFLSILPLITT